MTTKNTTDDELDDYDHDVDVDTAPIEEDREGGWDGRLTKIAVAFAGVFRAPLNKPQAPQFLEPGGKCVDCGAGGHQAHLRCSRDKISGQTVGPEADHLADLRAGGWLAKTKQARDRAQRQREVDMIRGTYGSPQRPEGFPEYEQITTARLKRMWRGELRFGPENLQQIERAEMRDETGRLREAVRDGMSDVAEVIREAMAERSSK